MLTYPNEATTHWGGASPWVQIGGNTLRNYWLSGAAQLHAREAAATYYVLKSQLSNPNGWERWKGLLGQRICGE